jgi:hypothetical protein
MGRSSGTGPFVEGGGGTAGVGLLECPSGVTAIDVVRVVAAPYTGSLRSQNVAKFNYTITLSALGEVTVKELIAVLSDGTPDLSLARPVRIDTTSTDVMNFILSCTSGIVSISPQCGGTLFLFGTRAP